MIEDYRGHTRSAFSRNTPSADDKDPERRLPGSSDNTQICKTPGQESSGRYFCIAGNTDSPSSEDYRRYPVLETFCQKLSEKVISPRQATPGSVGYDLFMPIDFVIQPNEQKTIFTDLALMPPEGYYAQILSKSGLTVLYELEVKARAIDLDYIGNIGVVLKNNSNKPIECVTGEQIAQLCHAITQRGEYGFGAHSAQ